MRKPVSIVVASAVAAMWVERIAWAGMPSLQVSDLGALRLQSISFFLFALLISAKVIQWLWNGVQQDFVWLPRLTYVRAVGATVLWGLLFIIVLTMISGARELMTPGAWERQGVTYRVKSEESPAASTELDIDREVRRRQADRLAIGLLLFARQHDGRFPASRDDVAFEGSLWEVSTIQGGRYQYVAGLTTEDSKRIVAYEPAEFDQPLFAITATGQVVEMKWDDLRRELEEAAK